MSSPAIGYGATLTRAGNPIAKVTNIVPPKLSADSVETSSNDSADGYREFIQGFRDGGEVSLEFRFDYGDTNGQIGLMTDFNAGTVQAFVITAKDSAWTFTFNAFVTAFEMDMPMDDVVGGSATLKLSGKPTLGVSASTGMSAFVLRNAADDGDADAVNYMPTIAIGTFYYAVTFTTQTSVRLRPTATSHTIKIYIDGVYSETIASGVSGSAIAISADASKTIRIEVFEANKTPKNYHITIARIS